MLEQTQFFSESWKKGHSYVDRSRLDSLTAKHRQFNSTYASIERWSSIGQYERLYLWKILFRQNTFPTKYILDFSIISGAGDVINCYLLSLAVADLLIGLCVVPLSVYPALIQRWVYGDLVCRLVGYLEVTLWAVSVYTFMWISVDRYLAVRKPLRWADLLRHWIWLVNIPEL